MVITIDGLGVNGKTTISKMISKEIGFKNFNTGAIYRCIALEIINKNLDVKNINDVIEKVKNINIDFREGKTYMNDIDVSSEIRTEKISVQSTKWATIPEIKILVRKIQQEFIKNNNTIMEGRDIGTRIAPNAEYKFYLYSDFETRVNRLWNDDKSIDINEIRKNLEIRDDLDINGGNFLKPENAIEIDTTNLTIKEVFNKIMSYIKL